MRAYLYFKDDSLTVMLSMIQQLSSNGSKIKISFALNYQ